MYAFTTQTSEASLKPRLSRIEGSATFTTVVSSTIISSPAHSTYSAHQRFSFSTMRIRSIAETVERLAPALLHSPQHRGGTRAGAAGNGLQGQLRAPVFRREPDPDDLIDLLDPALVGGAAIDDQALRRHHFPVAAVHPVFISPGGAHAQAEDPARTRVRFAGVHAEPARREPVSHVLGLGPALEQALARDRVEARRVDGVFAPLRGLCARAHFFPR